MEEQEKKPREFWFTLFRKGEERPLWHPELEIVFLMKGTGKIYFMDTKRMYTVREEDIFVINSFEISNFELEEDAIALSLFVSLRFAADVDPEFLQYPVVPIFILMGSRSDLTGCAENLQILFRSSIRAEMSPCIQKAR